jgi:hypothetical protein
VAFDVGLTVETHPRRRTEQRLDHQDRLALDFQKAERWYAARHTSGAVSSPAMPKFVRENAELGRELRHGIAASP